MEYTEEESNYLFELLYQNGFIDENGSIIEQVGIEDESTLESAEEEAEEEAAEEAQLIIEQWKEIYGEVFVADIDSEYFIYRLISLEEYNALQEITDNRYDLEDLVVQSCVLDPETDWTDEIFAGYTSTLAELILKQSLVIVEEGTDVKKLIEDKTKEVSNSFFEQLPLIIKHSFPEFTYKEIKQMPLSEQIEWYVRATWMLRNLEGMELSYNQE